MTIGFASRRAMCDTIVSVFIVSLNVKDLLRDCLRSVLREG